MAINSALSLVYNQLTAFAGLDDFWDRFDTAFGTQYDYLTAFTLKSQWQSQDFSLFPQIEVVSSEVLGTAKGAYAISTNKIYLSDAFISSASQQSLEAVILEEFGHFVDAQVNTADTAGDEGELFSDLVRGVSLSAAELGRIQAEDDHAIAVIDGQEVAIEQQNFTGTNGNDTITGTSGNDTISPLLGKDNVNGGAGTDLLVVDYSSNSYKGISSNFSSNGTGGFNGYFAAYYGTGGSDYNQVVFSNVEQFQVTGTGVADSIYTQTGNDTVNGGAGNDLISTNAGNDVLNGGAGRDTLTGGAGEDTYIFQFGQSSVSLTDRITDFSFDSDKISLLTSSGVATGSIQSFSIAANSVAADLTSVVSGVFADANGTLAGTQALGLNSAALVVVSTPAIAGTYLVVNDSKSGFQVDSDLVVNLTGYTGTLPSPGNSLSTATSVIVSSSGKNYRGVVNSTDPNDYYKFSLGSSNNYTLSLSGLSATATAQLLDSNGNVLNTLSNSLQTPQLINGTVSGGIYYVRVSSVGSVNTQYDLGLSVQPTLSGITTTASDAPIYINDIPVTSVFNPPLNPLTAQSTSLINLDDFRADPCFAGINGNGFSVVILDTGIDLDHPFFGPDSFNDGSADRIVYGQDFADYDFDASDNNGHGSNVSSIIASQDSIYTGMAPGANIIHLKVFPDSGGPGSFSSVEQALQWVANPFNVSFYNIASVNMSLGDGGKYTSTQALYGIDDEIANIVSQDIIVVSSSGNSFFDLPNPSIQGVGYPSADPNSLSVGAVYDANIGGVGYSSGAIAYTTAADRIAPFSQRDANLTTIFAPGAAITGANQNGGTVTMHGTSQAAPHIAGIAALAQQLAVQELGYRLTQAQFVSLLQSTGVIINDGDDEDDNVTNTGLNFKRVDVHALGKAIGAIGNNAPIVNTYIGGAYTPIPNTFPNAVFPNAVFTDPDGDHMTYTATLSNGNPLPSWLIFSSNDVPNPDQITFSLGSGVPASIPSPGIYVTLTATDCWGASASQTFSIFTQGSGLVIDGYIAGAEVFLDANQKNGIRDLNEPFTYTDANGAYQLNLDGFDTNNNGVIDPSEGIIIVRGGVDTSTGLPLETPLTAIPGSGVVTLLTTLVAKLYLARR